MARFRLGAVLRARQAQEDARKAAVAQARLAADTARGEVGKLERDLDRRNAPNTASAVAFNAAMSARQAVASALTTAMSMSRLADQGVQESLDDLAAAAVQRRTIEKLAERHAAARQHTAAAAEARSNDDLTTALQYQRSTARPSANEEAT
jgi:flagellar protein FliJ